jgi:hypothetical protein
VAMDPCKWLRLSRAKKSHSLDTAGSGLGHDHAAPLASAPGPVAYRFCESFGHLGAFRWGPDRYTVSVSLVHPVHWQASWLRAARINASQSRIDWLLLSTARNSVHTSDRCKLCAEGIPD